MGDRLGTVDVTGSVAIGPDAAGGRREGDQDRAGLASRVVSDGPVRSPLFSLASMDADRERIEVAIHEAVRSADPYLTEIASHLVVAGGKRLRPIVAIAAAQVGGRRRPTTPCAAAWPASSCTSGRCTTTTSSTRPTPGAASRRSTPSGATCRRSWPATSCSRGPRRSPPRIGTEVAGLLARTIGWLCEGEIEQLRHTYDVARPEDSYFVSIQGKTASLYGTAARIGGIVAGLDRPTIDALTAWGNAYGMVFQIVDDILDITDTTEQLGKPAGHDLVEGVYTLPVLRTLALGRSVGDELASLLGRPLDVAERDKALAIVRANEGVESAAVDRPPVRRRRRGGLRRPPARCRPPTPCAPPRGAPRVGAAPACRLGVRAPDPASRCSALGSRVRAAECGGAGGRSARGGLVGGLGGADLVGAQEVGHDPQHPLHQRAAVHAGPGQLPHQGRAADHPGEQAGHLEVLPVLVLSSFG